MPPIPGRVPSQVEAGAGTLYIAPTGSIEPIDLATAWPAAWVDLGYTEEGSTFTFDQTFEDLTVEEELEPLDVLQTARMVTIAFALAQLTATNIQRALNGGTITTGTGIVTFEAPLTGVAGATMLGWQSNDADERWVFRRCRQVSTVTITNRKAPQKRTVPMGFRATKPDNAASFKVIMSDARH